MFDRQTLMSMEVWDMHAATWKRTWDDIRSLPVRCPHHVSTPYSSLIGTEVVAVITCDECGTEIKNLGVVAQRTGDPLGGIVRPE